MKLDRRILAAFLAVAMLIPQLFVGITAAADTVQVTTTPLTAQNIILKKDNILAKANFSTGSTATETCGGAAVLTDGIYSTITEGHGKQVEADVWEVSSWSYPRVDWITYDLGKGAKIDSVAFMCNGTSGVETIAVYIEDVPYATIKENEASYTPVASIDTPDKGSRFTFSQSITGRYVTFRCTPTKPYRYNTTLSELAATGDLGEEPILVTATPLSSANIIPADKNILSPDHISSNRASTATSGGVAVLNDGIYSTITPDHGKQIEADSWCYRSWTEDHVDWITYDLGENASFDSVLYMSDGGTPLKSVAVYVEDEDYTAIMENESAYEPVASVSGASSHSNRFDFSKSITGRYLTYRFVPTKPHDYVTALSELAAIGTKGTYPRMMTTEPLNAISAIPVEDNLLAYGTYSSNAKPTDTCGGVSVLTDGIYSTVTEGHGKQVEADVWEVSDWTESRVDWITYDLGEGATIESVAYMGNGTAGFNTMQVFVEDVPYGDISADESAFEPVIDLTKGDLGSRITFSESVTGRYITFRFTPSKPYKYNTTLSELAVTGYSSLMPEKQESDPENDRELDLEEPTESGYVPLVRAGGSIFLDTDIGADSDDTGAMAIMLNLMKKNNFTISGIVNSTSCVYGNGAIDAICSYYGVELDKTGIYNYESFRDADDGYNRYLTDNMTTHRSEMVPSTQYYHDVYESQPDNSITLVTIGSLKAVAAFIEAYPDLFNAKTRAVICMGCNFEPGIHGFWPYNGANVEYNIYIDSKSANKFATICEKPVIWSPWELTADRVICGFYEMDWDNPVAVAYYMIGKGTPTRAACDPSAVQFAIEGDIGLFNFSKPGRAVIDAATGKSTFVFDPDGKDIYIRENRNVTLTAEYYSSLIQAPADVPATLFREGASVEVATSRSQLNLLGTSLITGKTVAGSQKLTDGVYALTEENAASLGAAIESNAVTVDLGNAAEIEKLFLARGKTPIPAFGFYVGEDPDTLYDAENLVFTFDETDAVYTQADIFNLNVPAVGRYVGIKTDAACDLSEIALYGLMAQETADTVLERVTSHTQTDSLGDSLLLGKTAISYQNRPSAPGTAAQGTANPEGTADAAVLTDGDYYLPNELRLTTKNGAPVVSEAAPTLAKTDACGRFVKWSGADSDRFYYDLGNEAEIREIFLAAGLHAEDVLMSGADPAAAVTVAADSYLPGMKVYIADSADTLFDAANLVYTLDASSPDWSTADLIVLKQTVTGRYVGFAYTDTQTKNRALAEVAVYGVQTRLLADSGVTVERVTSHAQTANCGENLFAGKLVYSYSSFRNTGALNEAILRPPANVNGGTNWEGTTGHLMLTDGDYYLPGELKFCTKPGKPGDANYSEALDACLVPNDYQVENKAEPPLFAKSTAYFRSGHYYLYEEAQMPFFDLGEPTAIDTVMLAAGLRIEDTPLDELASLDRETYLKAQKNVRDNSRITYLRVYIGNDAKTLYTPENLMFTYKPDKSELADWGNVNLFRLPEAVKGRFVGFMFESATDPHRYVAEFAAFSNAQPQKNLGTQLKASEDGTTAMRFGFRLDCTGVQYQPGSFCRDITAGYLVKNGLSYKLVDFGAILSTKEDAEMTLGGDGVVAVKAEKLYYAEQDGATFTVAVNDIPEDQWDKKITARSYAVYINGKGEQITVYGKPITRAVNDFMTADW